MTLNHANSSNLDQLALKGFKECLCIKKKGLSHCQSTAKNQQILELESFVIKTRLMSLCNWNHPSGSQLMTCLKDAGSVRRAPGIEQVVFAGASEPLATVGKLQWQHAALMQMKLILVGFGLVQHLHVTALHTKHTSPSYHIIIIIIIISYHIIIIHELSTLNDTRCALLHCVSKEVPTFKLSVILSNLNRFSKSLHCWKAHEICYKKLT